MAATQEALQEQLKVEQKAKNKLSIQTIRMMMDAIQKKAQKAKDDAIKNGETFDGLTDQEEITALQKFKNDTKDEIAQFSAVGNATRVEYLTQTLDVITAYIPEPLSVEELTDIVRKTVQNTVETGRKIGIILKAVKPLVEGRADNKELSAIVQQVIAESKE